jgi:hypothetical protein
MPEYGILLTVIADQDLEDLVAEVADGTHRAEQGEDARFTPDEGGFGRAPGEYLQTNIFAASTDLATDPIIPTFPPRQPRAGGHVKSSKNKGPATAPSEGDTASETVKGKRKVNQGDEIDMDRPRRKSARQSAALRDLDSARSPPDKKRKRRVRDEDDDEERENEFTAPYAGKGKGKATAKRGRQE